MPSTKGRAVVGKAVRLAMRLTVLVLVARRVLLRLKVGCTAYTLKWRHAPVMLNHGGRRGR